MHGHAPAPPRAGAAHEAELWAEFQAAKDGTALDRWLYNRGDDPNRPGDLGYFVGYRIAQAYAKQRGDLAAAIRELVRAKDAKRVLAESAYAGAPP